MRAFRCFSTCALVLLATSCDETTTSPLVAAQLAFVAQPVTTTAGQTIPQITVAIQDANGNTVTSSNAFVTISVGEGLNQPLIGTTNVQAVNGVATFSGLKIQSAGTGYRIVATLPGLVPDTSDAFTILPGAPVSMRFAMHPTHTTAGQEISDMWVSIYDQYDNHVFGLPAIVTIALAENPGGGVLSGTLSDDAPGGVAAFTDVSINKSGAGYKFIATSPGFASPTSNAFNIRPAAATKLRFTVPPSNAVEGASITPAVVVEALDAFDNVDTTFKSPITMSLVASNGATLLGTTVVTALEGRATFPNLSISQAANGYQLSASATSLTSATSPSFDVTAASVPGLSRYPAEFDPLRTPASRGR
jgi:hypothetical protein